jgi:hypothetical protein
MLFIKLLRHVRFWVILAIAAVDITFFTMTDPNKGSSIMLMAGFILFILSLYYLINRLLIVGVLYGLSIGMHTRRLALCITGVIAGLLALQSIGELTTKDALIFAPLAVIMYVYLSYGRIKLDSE